MENLAHIRHVTVDALQNPFQMNPNERDQCSVVHIKQFCQTSAKPNDLGCSDKKSLAPEQSNHRHSTRVYPHQLFELFRLRY